MILDMATPAAMGAAWGVACPRRTWTAWPTKVSNFILLRPAKLHAPARGDDHRAVPLPQRNDDDRFPGSGRGLPKAEWTLASVLKTGGYKTYFTGKWHLGEADYALPSAHGFDVMKYCFLYHLNAYTYADPEWFPDMPEELRDMFQKVTKGALSGNAGEQPHEDFKVNGEYVDTPEKGVVGIPFLDAYVKKAALGFLDDAAKNPDKPFFMDINFMKVHQPNCPTRTSFTSRPP
jgi:arylsulfatase A-like enzyme